MKFLMMFMVAWFGPLRPTFCRVEGLETSQCESFGVLPAATLLQKTAFDNSADSVLKSERKGTTSDTNDRQIIWQQVWSSFDESRTRAAVGFSFGGHSYHYNLTAFSVYADHAIAHEHTEYGDVPLKTNGSRTFQAPIHGKRASAVFLESGAVSGLFQVRGGYVVKLKPETHTRKSGIFLLQGGQALHRISIFLGPASHIKGRIRRLNGSVNIIRDTVHNGSTGDDAPVLVEDSEDDINADGRGGDLNDDDHMAGFAFSDSSMHDPYGGALYGDTSKVQTFFPGCFAGDNELHEVTVGTIADKGVYDKFKDNTQQSIEEIVALTSFVFEYQLNIQLKLNYFKMYSSESGAPDYAKKTCEGDRPIYDRLDQLRDAVRNEEVPYSAATHLFIYNDGCTWKKGERLAGLAYVTGLCRVDGCNTGVNVMEEVDQAFAVLRHEMGHNFGANHHDKGGFMGGNTGVDGVLQFHQTVKTEVCEHLNKKVNKCKDTFKACEGCSRTPENRRRSMLKPSTWDNSFGGSLGR